MKGQNKLLVVLVAGVLLMTAGVLKAYGAEEGAPIKIGMPVPITGAYASDGEEMVYGATLAVDEINAEGGLLGKRLEIVTADTGELEADKVVAAGEKLIHRDKVDAVVTGYADSGADIDEFGQYEVPYLHVDTNDVCAFRMAEMMPQYSNIFMCDTHTLMYGPVTADFFEKTLSNKGVKCPNKRVALIAAEEVWARSIIESQKESMEKLGWEAVAFETVLPGVAEWKTIIAKVKAKDPAVVSFINLSPRGCATFLGQFRESPADSIVFMVYTPAMPEFMDLAGKDANGTVWTTVIGPLPGPRNDRLLKKYQDKFNRKPGFCQHAACYDMVYMWAKAVEKVGDEKDYPAVCKTIENSNYEGVCGKYVFDPKTHWAVCSEDAVPPHMYQIQNEESVLIWPDRYATGNWKMPEWLSSKWR